MDNKKIIRRAVERISAGIDAYLLGRNSPPGQKYSPRYFASEYYPVQSACPRHSPGGACPRDQIILPGGRCATANPVITILTGQKYSPRRFASDYYPAGRSLRDS